MTTPIAAPEAGVSFDLSEDQLAVREMVRDFAETEIRPIAAQIDETHEFPAANVKKMAELGLLGMFVPEEWGGAGMDYVSYVIAIEELSRRAGDFAIVAVATVVAYAAAILTEAIERADFLHTGFSGFMQPVLEDSVLAKRAAEGTLTIKDALLYSTVCGTGLDTIPLPGDTTAEQLVPLLLDLSALALRLNKPLTARLMPIPGKKAGDETNFDFAFFAQSKVMMLESESLNSPLNGNEVLKIKSR